MKESDAPKSLRKNLQNNSYVVKRVYFKLKINYWYTLIQSIIYSESVKSSDGFPGQKPPIA